MKDIEILKYINKNSDYVRINEQKIIPFINKIDNFGYKYWLSNENLNEKELVIFSFKCESLNFCFWDNLEWYVECKNNIYKSSEALFIYL